MATIEIFARDVKGFGIFGAQHLFIISTDDNGDKSIIRGGPKHGHELTDDLYIVNSPYEERYKHLYPGDFIEGNPSCVIFIGSNEQMQIHVDRMGAKVLEINLEHYDYKLPMPGCHAALCHIQNSNTVVKELVKAADLQLQLPVLNGQEIWAPGINGDRKHTIIDEGGKRTP